jgi:hypothetical protein
LVRLVVQADELLVEPISILRTEKNDSPVFQLSFDPLGDHARQPDSDRDDVEDPQLDEEVGNTAESLVIPNVTLNRVLTELNEHLLAIAETGIQKGMATHQQWFSESTAEVHTLGLTALAKAMDTLANQKFSPAQILRTRYLTHLHSQAVSHCAIP